MQKLPGFKRVVTGHDAAGQAVVAFSGPTTNNFPLKAVPGTVFYEVWNSAASPAQNQVSAADAAAAFAEIGQAHAGTGKSDSRHKLMHRTETLDYGIVTEGEVWLVLDGEDVQLKRGDIVVQRGTNHAWSNRTEQMARMVFILLDGRYAEALQEVLK
jgi:hypothetical protein